MFDAFFTGWYNNYNDFRQIEKDLGIGRREIVINEYARSLATGSTADLAVPGNLIQFITRFETSKVYACLAYWTGHGTLNVLVANNNTNQKAVGSSYNQPTGAWYLYLSPARFNSANADANCDGSVNINDALLVARFAAGLITNQGC